MIRRKANPTPVIVGTVIALLGILTGLYFAQNAREQQLQPLASDMPEVPLPADPAQSASAALPADASELDAVAVDELPAVEGLLDEDTAADALPAAEQPADTPATQETAVSEEAAKADVPATALPAAADTIVSAEPAQKTTAPQPQAEQQQQQEPTDSI